MMPPGGVSLSTTIVAFSGKDRLRETVGPGLFEHWGLESGVL